MSAASPGAADRVQVRRFTEDDRLACQQIAARAAQTSYGPRIPHLAGRLEETRPLEPAEVRLVAALDGAPAGFLDLIGAHVSNLFVIPEHQGHGLGRRLLTAAEAMVEGDVTLSVFTANPDARRLYERCGYRLEGEAWPLFEGVATPVWRMRKPRPCSPPYRLVIFDLDGVLADSADWFITALARLSGRHGLRSVSEAEIARLRGLPTRQILRALGVRPWRAPAIARDLRRLARDEAGSIGRFAGVDEMLQALAGAGVELGLVSSNAEDNVRRILGDADAARISRYACGASLFGKARRIAALVRDARLAPREVVYVGDETRDIEAARTAKVAAAATTWGYATAEVLQSQSPDLLFRGMAEMQAALTGGRRT